jgi:hypothetical protein
MIAVVPRIRFIVDTPLEVPGDNHSVVISTMMWRLRSGDPRLFSPPL